MLASSETGPFDAIIWGVFFGGGLLVVIIAIISDALRKTAIVKAREESRREIAAYVAEGSISPDDAAKLLAAGGNIGDKLKEKIRQKMCC